MHQMWVITVRFEPTDRTLPGNAMDKYAWPA